MKFQKDNVNISLTQEDKEQIQREKEELERQLEEQKMETERVKQEYIRLNQEYFEIANKLEHRHIAYLPIDCQLDLLWHDMKRGVIKIDQKREDTWFSHIKKVKDNIPIDREWREKLPKLEDEIKKLVANNNIEIV